GRDSMDGVRSFRWMADGRAVRRAARSLSGHVQSRLLRRQARAAAARRARAPASADRLHRSSRRTRAMSETAGLWMLVAVAIVMIATGLPSWIVLLGVALSFAAAGVAASAISWSILTAMPARIVGLLENDLLQALPLYVLMGTLLNRL